MVQKLPLRRFAIGDNAYVCSETLLTPFSGVEKNDPFYSNLHQKRIHIEQKFRLTAKQRILHQPLQIRLKHNGKVFKCNKRLHNFCINECNTYLNSAEDTQVGDSVFMHSDANETKTLQEVLCLGTSVFKNWSYRDFKRHHFITLYIIFN